MPEEYRVTPQPERPDPEFENIEGGSHGYYHLENKRTAINQGMSELQTLKTAIREIAHAKLHDIDLNAPKDEQQPHVDCRTREVEAESSLETIRNAAAEIINSIDGNLAKLQKAQDKEQTTREEKEAAPQPEAAAQEKAGVAPKEVFTPETIYRVRRFFCPTSVNL